MTKSYPVRLSPAGVLTPAGMAHWAGSGPPGTTCRECCSWASVGKWREEGPGGSGEPLPSRCRKYKALGMTKVFGPAIPHDTPSCKHFEAAPKPQPLKRPQKIEADWLA
jgi:hypothetical protein